MEERKYSLEKYIDSVGEEWYRVRRERNYLRYFKRDSYLGCVYKIAEECIITTRFINNPDLINEILEMISKVPIDVVEITYVGFILSSDLKPEPSYFQKSYDSAGNIIFKPLHKNYFDNKIIGHVTIKYGEKE